VQVSFGLLMRATPAIPRTSRAEAMATDPRDHLLIFGASARAAAFSALRAGLRPWCADLFADADLQAVCPVQPLPAGKYPLGFLELVETERLGPWMYTGGLENRPGLVRRMAQRRSLWGNDAPVLRVMRRPQVVARLLRAADLACPEVYLRAANVPAQGRWLAKPRFGAGGTGIHFWNGEESERRRRPVYFQEYLAGGSCAAVYVAGEGQARLLGVTRQLVGATWLHAAPFHYCGSIGPLHLTSTLRSALERVGNALAGSASLSSEKRLRGLFGVDFILRDGIPWPVEVNPRYTASVEVLEYALGLSALAWHRHVFDRDAPCPPALSASNGILGKAILFARAPLRFPAHGPWRHTLDQLPKPISAARLRQPPAFADIPHAGQHLEAGRPILTIFARAASVARCTEALRRIAADLDRQLFGP
jgi:predicted ATP-grasp superfamily ATP-dependent carboligase